MRETWACKTSVWNWPKRCLESGIDGLTKEKSKRPDKAPLPDAAKAKMVEMAATSGPDNATHWRLRLLAKANGISLRSVERMRA